MATKAVLEWRDLHGDGGNLSLWTAYGKDVMPYGDFFADSVIAVFKDERTDAFVALETDFPNEVPEYANALRAESYPLVDVPEAGLTDVHPADALLWGYHHLIPRHSSALGV